MLEQEGVAGALTAHALTFAEFTDGHRALVQRGFNPRRSGDVVIWLEPHWLPMWSPTARTTHGSAYSYDTHVPLVWYGAGIPAGRSASAVHISDIASTLAVFPNAPFPSGNVGAPMNGLIR
jgi:hypothetical protein